MVRRGPATKCQALTIITPDTDISALKCNDHQLSNEKISQAKEVSVGGPRLQLAE